MSASKTTAKKTGPKPEATNVPIELQSQVAFLVSEQEIKANEWYLVNVLNYSVYAIKTYRMLTDTGETLIRVDYENPLSSALIVNSQITALR